MSLLDCSYKFAENIQATETNGELVLLDLTKEEFYGLNGTGALVWRELTSGKTLQQCVQALLAEYEVSREEAHQDVLEIVRLWKSQGWLVEN